MLLLSLTSVTIIKITIQRKFFKKESLLIALSSYIFYDAKTTQTFEIQGSKEGV